MWSVPCVSTSMRMTAETFHLQVLSDLSDLRSYSISLIFLALFLEQQAWGTTGLPLGDYRTAVQPVVNMVGPACQLWRLMPMMKVPICLRSDLHQPVLRLSDLMKAEECAGSMTETH